MVVDKVVCDKVACDKVVCERWRWRRRRRRRRRDTESKTRIPHKDVGKKQKHLLPSRNLTDDHEKNTIVIAVKLNALDLVHVHMKAEFCHPYIKLNAWDEESA